MQIFRAHDYTHDRDGRLVRVFRRRSNGIDVEVFEDDQVDRRKRTGRVVQREAVDRARHDRQRQIA